jgi:hypothetical protein
VRFHRAPLQLPKPSSIKTEIENKRNFPMKRKTLEILINRCYHWFYLESVWDSHLVMKLDIFLGEVINIILISLMQKKWIEFHEPCSYSKSNSQICRRTLMKLTLQKYGYEKRLAIYSKKMLAGSHIV